MKKQYVIAGTAVLGLFLILAVTKGLLIWRAITMHAFTPPPEAVHVSQVKEEQWPEMLRAVGSLAAVRGSTLKAEMQGRVTRVEFEGGEEVQANTPLVFLDTGVEEGDLNASEAMARLSDQNLKRAATLRAANANATSDLEKAQAELDRARAQAAALRATIRRKQIFAPFAGHLGSRLVSVGQFVSPGDPLVTLESLDAMLLNFRIPQRHVAGVKPGATATVSIDAYPQKKFTATIRSIEPQVDEQTRTLLVQGLIDNGGRELRPGMFAEVEVQIAEPTAVLTVPITAVNEAPYGDSVFIVEQLPGVEGNEPYTGVRQVNVKLGTRRGDRVVVTSGLKAGMTVASSGIFKLRPLIAVLPVKEDGPGESVDPKPANT